ncbi:MAG: 4Fe-4S binding protein [Pirellulales bacterium]|nr:4Fe-4S binding protein [Pirellulales bacterium]
MANNGRRRVIEVHRNLLGPPEPKRNTVRPRKLADYAGVPQVYLAVAEKLASPLLMGPPICDELIALVRHLFTEEEAGAVRHLGGLAWKSARQVAKAEHRPLDEVEPILERLASQRRIIGSTGKADKRRFGLLPILPGIFEMVLVGESPETMSEWHRRFAELIEVLFETGYFLDYTGVAAAMVRYLPLGTSIDAHPMALPSDRLEVVMDRFDDFAVGNCQCRMSAAVAGHACDRPLGNCMVMGHWARRGIRDGWVRRVAKDEALAIKKDAESHGLVTWMMNVESTRGQISCSCCGCCCKAMRMVNEFNAPNVMAPPHFLPIVDGERCTHCGKCARACPMGAIAIDLDAKLHKRQTERCIGCGLCAVACERQKAIRMEAVPDYKLPYRSWFSLISHTAPGAVKGAWNVWRARRSGSA